MGRRNGTTRRGRRGPLNGAAVMLAGALASPAPVSPARAADLAPPRRAVPAFVDWSGGYLGIEGSAGASFGALNFGPTRIGGRPVPPFKTGDSTGSSDRSREATTAVGGVLAGWNWQRGPWLTGIEADIAGANLKRPVPSTAGGFGYAAADPEFSLIRAKTDLYGVLRARFGLSFERALVYATFGLAGAQTRFLATYPDPAAGTAATARTERGTLGFTLGAGVQYAITDRFALGLDYRYLDLGSTGRFGLGSVPGLGPVSTQASFTSHQMLARLLWFPGGLGLPAEAEPASSPDDRYSFHGQTTFINQGVPGFRSPYRGDNSLVPHQAQATTTATLFLGFKLMEGTELYYNPEFSQGFGLSRTLGVAGFVNGEAQKAGAPFPKLRSNRYFVRQTFGLGGETEEVPDGPNQVATRRDVERITVVAGKFALGDFFDGNAYAHDPRVDFMNWSVWGASAWDFPANLPGFTQGMMVEYNQAAFALRAAYTQVPKQPSSDVLDPRVFDRGGAVIELEERHTLPGLDQPGRIRLGAFSNVGNTAGYRQVVALRQGGAFADIDDAAAATRRPRRKSGVYANLEQAVSADLGVFARASYSDGRNESLSFTDVDRSVSGGISLKGARWDRPADTVGLGGAINGLSDAHKAFFANGGLGLLIGDGRLNYAPERALEAYYAMSLTGSVTLSLNYQFVVNPAYNRDRGPASFFGTRLHADF